MTPGENSGLPPVEPDDWGVEGLDGRYLVWLSGRGALVEVSREPAL